MNTKKTIVTAILAIVLMLASVASVNTVLAAGTTQDQIQTNQTSPDDHAQQIIITTGTVRFICNVAGCFWGIYGDDHNNYEPLTFPKNLQVEGLRATFKFRVLKNAASIFMWGTMVDILNYQIIQ